MLSYRCFAACLALTMLTPVFAGPNYDQGEDDLLWVMARLKDWLPGAWDSYPQIEYERSRRMPEGGEHEHWHRSFALIDAPQVGEVVFYGQINTGGRSGPLMPRTQIVYKVYIDAERGAVVMNGQPPADPQKFVDLQDKPELWGQVQMRDESTLNCDFLWRRDGQQIFGVLDGKTEDRRKYGPGSCNYIMRNTDAEFYADAEWVLGPEDFWIYDINTVRGQLFIGRADKTHVRLYRARPYLCEVDDGAGGLRRLNAYDRGFEKSLETAAGRLLDMQLLRAEFPSAEQGLVDRLRLLLREPGSADSVAMAESDPMATGIALQASRLTISCRLQARFPPLAAAD